MVQCCSESFIPQHRLRDVSVYGCKNEVSVHPELSELARKAVCSFWCSKGWFCMRKQDLEGKGLHVGWPPKLIHAQILSFGVLVMSERDFITVVVSWKEGRGGKKSKEKWFSKFVLQPNFNSRCSGLRQGVVVHICNPNGRVRSSGIFGCIGQSGLHETLSQASNKICQPAMFLQ